MSQQPQDSYNYYSGAYDMTEDREIYGIGPNRDMPSLCPHCKGNPRDRLNCTQCGSTGMLGLSGISAGAGQDSNQTPRGGSSSGRGSSTGNSSSSFRSSRR